METGQGEFTTVPSDYFAERLLNKLDATEPVFAAYEAQDLSREVGFDFADFQDVVPRALDEIRETKEAFEEEGAEAREHFGDEIADIMFSLVNLARHAGLTDLASLQTMSAQNGAEAEVADDTPALIDKIGQHIITVAEAEKTGSPTFLESMANLYEKGMKDAIRLARANGFDPQVLLKENVRKYLVRCVAIEKLASEDGKQWADLAANNEIIAYWKRAKILLK